MLKTKKLGQGGFGAVFLVDDAENGFKAALKIERMDEVHLLKMELIVLEKLNEVRARHVTKLLGKGRNNKYSYIVMGLVGPNLGDVKKKCQGEVYSLGTATRVSKQCIEAMEDIHNIGYLHRDIKPGNFAVGKHPREVRTVYMLDYGMARLYKKASGDVRTARTAAGFRGTPRYASLNVHRDKDQGRESDMWSLFYMMVEYTGGSLPWRGVQDKDEIGKVKERTSPRELMSKCPPEYGQIHDHLSSLGYYDEPDYALMISILQKCERKNRIRDDDPYDWEK